MTSNTKATPQRVNWFNIEDFQVAMLASLGIRVRAIAARTAYSEGQVRYRMKKAGVKLNDYRDMARGTLGGNVAEAVLRTSVSGIVRGALRHQMPARRSAVRSR